MACLKAHDSLHALVTCSAESRDELDTIAEEFENRGVIELDDEGSDPQECHQANSKNGEL